MKLVITKRIDGRYGVSVFDLETGESLGSVFGTRIFRTLDAAKTWVKTQETKILNLHDEFEWEVR